MSETLNSMLEKLQLNRKWFDLGLVDLQFIESAYLALNNSEAEHVRTKAYSKFFDDRESRELTDKEISDYLVVVGFEIDPVLKSWAIGFLVESGQLNVTQLEKLKECSFLEEKHHYFLQREINEKVV